MNNLKLAKINETKEEIDSLTILYVIKNFVKYLQDNQYVQHIKINNQTKECIDNMKEECDYFVPFYDKIYEDEMAPNMVLITLQHDVKLKFAFTSEEIIINNYQKKDSVSKIHEYKLNIDKFVPANIMQEQYMSICSVALSYFYGNVQELINTKLKEIELEKVIEEKNILFENKYKELFTDENEEQMEDLKNKINFLSKSKEDIEQFLTDYHKLLQTMKG